MPGAVVPVQPPKVVCEKLGSARMFRLRYQFKPTDQAWRRMADVAELAKPSVNALSSTFNSRITRHHCHAPHWPLRGSNGCSGVTPL